MRRQPIIIIFIIFIYPSIQFLAYQTMIFGVQVCMIYLFISSYHIIYPSYPLKVLEQEQRPIRISKCLRYDTLLFFCTYVTKFCCFCVTQVFHILGMIKYIIPIFPCHAHALRTRLNRVWQVEWYLLLDSRAEGAESNTLFYTFSIVFRFKLNSTWVNLQENVF